MVQVTGNRVKVSATASSTTAYTLGAAIDSFSPFTDGEFLVTILASDNTWQTGLATVSGTSLTMGTVEENSAGTEPIKLDFTGKTIQIAQTMSADSFNTKVEQLNELPLSTVIGSPTHITQMEQVFSHVYSAGITDGGVVSDAGLGAIDVTTGECFIRASADGRVMLEYSTFTGVIGVTLTDNVSNYVYIDYNAGSPNVAVTLDPTSVDVQTKIPLAIVVREGNTLTIFSVGDDSVDANASLRKRLFYTDTFKRSNGGAVISSPAGRYVACSAGAFWFGLHQEVLPSIDTSVIGDFEYYYTTDSGTTWVEVNSTQLSNTQYNDITSGLVSIPSNDFVNNWVYAIMSTEGTTHYGVVYGQTSYNTAAEALAGGLPSTLPPSISGLGVLLGVITVRQGTADATDIRSAFDTVFSSSQATSHNELSDIGTLTHVQLEASLDTKQTVYTGPTPPASPNIGDAYIYTVT